MTAIRLGRFTAIISWSIYSLVALISAALPVGYAVIQTQYLRGEVLAAANFEAMLVRQRLAISVVDHTMYAAGLAQVLHNPAQFSDPNPTEVERLLDTAGNPIASSSQGAPLPPVISATVPVLLDDGTAVGQVTIERSARRVLVVGLLIAAAAAILGGLLIVAIRFLPLRSLRKAEQELSRMARFDFMTGLVNREHALQQVETLLRRSWRQHTGVALFFIDLDQFKMVNDSRGHHTGDAVLKESARRLTDHAGSHALVARLGGDEFMIACAVPTSSHHPADPNAEDSASHHAAVAIARTLLGALRHPIEIGNESFYLTASIGIALSPQHGTTSTELIERADTAMYAAKCHHRDQYKFFQQDMIGASQARLRLQSDLKNAIDKEEYALVYQPLIRLKDMEIVGAEALLRWERPTGPPMSPAEFVPMLEESGLIISVGEWIFRTACRQVVRFRRLQPDFFVAVNISVRQFVEDDFEAMVHRVLAETGAPGIAIELELTESLLIERSDKFVEKMTRLKQVGLRLSMDDFGTGYSSLSRLKSMPVDVLKIDRSFISGAGEGLADTGIVDAVLALAHGLELAVVAEGVETENQRDALRLTNCTFGQGYLFARPMAPGALEEKITAAVNPNETMPLASKYIAGGNDGTPLWSS